MKTTTIRNSLARLTLLASCIGLTACVTNDEQPAADNNANRIQELQVVDCLLPGQTRMLGNQVYLTPRRPILTTAADCQIRGGEYVAYDRADYKTSLNVWMPAANEGDPEAQANVGEIFERGLGGEPNYEVAALWYQKAADQGNQRALFNLGTLYEQGLGVEKDKLLAMNLYRQAWGLPEDSLVFQSSLDEQQRAAEQKLKDAVAKKDKQIRLLQTQIAAIKVEMKEKDQSQELMAQISDLNELVGELEKDNTASKAKLAQYAAAASKRKIRTVIAKDQKTFKSDAKEVLSKDINFGRYYALVIGIQDYDNVEDLDTPINDIDAVADVLSNQYGFSVEKVINADNVSVMEAINNLNQQLTEDDNLLIFYAGHGVRLQNEKLESGYWLPTNADAPPRDTNWVSNEFITRHLARIKAKRVMVVADSCYAGLLSSSPDFLLVGDAQNSVEFLKYKAQKRSRLLMTSGGDQPVLDSEGNGAQNSIFAKAFVDALKNNKEILTGPQLFKQVHDKVAADSKAASFEQEPQYKAIKGAGHEVGEFFFVPQS